MTVAILLNAPSLDIEIAEDHIICADGGYKLLKNKKPDAIVGDFDSLTNIPENIKIVRLPKEKNFTDGEYALRYAIDCGYDDIVIYGGLGGRFDHVIGNFALLKLAHTLGVNAKISEKDLSIYYTNTYFSLKTVKGQTISILPYAGNAVVAHSEGLYYPLENLKLKPDDTRGISNLALGNSAKIKIQSGEVIVFHYFK